MGPGDLAASDFRALYIWHDLNSRWPLVIAFSSDHSKDIDKPQRQH
jgi:hypothetical protein